MRRPLAVSPSGGFAEMWLAAQTFAESTRESVAGRLVRHVYPHFGDTELRAIGPAMIQAWGRRLQQQGLAETYRRTLFANVSGVFTAAIDDERIRRNPYAGRSVTRPRGEYPKVVPWSAERVHAVRAEMGERYRLTVDLGAGCGLRQGEAFGLCVDQVNFADRAVQVIRQVKIVRSRLVFGPPKHGKTREVPLPDSIARAIRAHTEQFPPLAVTLPWQHPDGELVTARLLMWTREAAALNRNYFNHFLWKPALRQAGVPEPKRAERFHALRHFYASVLLDASESIKALAEYLGHADPGFTLRTYTTSCRLAPSAPAGPWTACSIWPTPSTRKARNPRWKTRTPGLRRPSDGLIMGSRPETPGQNSSVIRRRSTRRTRRGAGAGAGGRSRSPA
ncbi:MAG: tyrosine-type recombinase/integrase [Pseudonocardiaceae bacterium]